MAPFNFLVNIYPRYDSFCCDCVPGGLDCQKCPVMILCADCDKISRCRCKQKDLV